MNEGANNFDNNQ